MLINNLRNARRSKGLLQEDCAELLGIKTRKYSYIESAKPERISYATLLTLSKTLDVPVTTLVVETN